MDTTKLQLEAENYISSILSKYEFLVSKPQYDLDGCDLQVLDNVSYPTRLLRIQSKGRTFINPTNVEIPKKYVGDNFILFLYLVDSEKNDSLYNFFHEQIKDFSSNDETYRIYCSKKVFESEYRQCRFTKEKAAELKKRLLSARIKEGTTVVIDSFCLEKAIISTIGEYKRLYPAKKFDFPDTLDIIKQILNCYDKNKFENRIINVYLFLTPYNSIRTKFYDSDELFVEKNKIRIFEMRIDGLISFEIEDFLKRIINVENILLVVSDIKYLPLLEELKNENKEIALVCKKLENGLRNYGFKWGDIVYPIGLSMGLKEYEL